MRLVAIVAILLLSGCATGGGSRWYAPATWFSHAPADKADKADARLDVAKDNAVKAAQKLVHETTEALASAPASRQVKVATESSLASLGLLDQVAGPLTAAELTAIRSRVAGLLSDNAALRAEAEAARDRESQASSKTSAKLAEAEVAVETSRDALRKQYEVENRLANQLRSQHAFLAILGVLTVIAAGGWAYVRFALGGIPNALGMALSAAHRQNPVLADSMRTLLDSHLNRSEQDAVRAAFVKATG